MVISKVAIPLFVSSFCFCFSALAEDNPAFIPTIPGITLSGYAGNGWTTQADTLIPVFGTSNNFTYINSQFLYHSQGGTTGSFGLGQRWLSHNNIFGLYLFTDYNNSPQNKDFWFVSPGFEYIGSIFNFSLNSYIPISKQKYHTGTVFANQNNDFSKTYFSGHQQYSELVDTYNVTGWGGDALIGFHLPFKNIQLSAGSYYFSPEDHSEVIGGVIRLDVPINNYFSASFSETYDNLTHHTIKAGLSISLGGRHNKTSFHDLKQHLVDPVNRQLIAINGGSYNGEPVIKTEKNTGKMAVEKDNISFFMPDNSSNMGNNNDGTYENPYQEFNQSNVDDANKQNNRNFYLNSGTYNAHYALDKNEITLSNDLLFGRQENFLKPAEGENRPILFFDQGGLTIADGDQKVALSDLVLKGLNTGAGININHLDNDSPLSLKVSNLSIDGFNDGIRVNNVSEKSVNVVIDNTHVVNNSNLGILAQNNGNGGINLSVNKSQVNNNGEGIRLVNYQAGNLIANIYKSEINENLNNGIYAANIFNPGTLRVDVYGSTINNNGYNGVSLYNGTGNIVNSGNLIANLDYSTIANNGASGIHANNTSTGDLHLNINHSSINSNSWDGINAINTMDSGSFVFNLKNSQVNGNYSGGLVIFNEKSLGSFTLNIEKSSVENNYGDGIFLDNSLSSGNLNVKITDTSITGNEWTGIFALNDSDKGNLNLIIDKSQINHNGESGLYLDNNSSGGSLNTSINQTQINNNGSGILLLNEKSNGSMDLKVSDAEISDNRGDGLSLYEGSLGGKITAEVNNSAITGNMGYGLGAGNNVVATVNNSIISGNDSGIIAVGGGVININDPKYLDSNISSMDGTINFNGVQAPSEASRVHCESNQCTFSSNSNQ